MNKLTRHTANVFLPGCLGPVKREVVLDSDCEALEAENAKLTRMVEGAKAAFVAITTTVTGAVTAANAVQTLVIGVLRSRVAQLEAETVPVADLLALLPGTHYMDPPDGGDVPVLEQLRRMSEDAAKYRKWLFEGRCE